jgi:hypothetical protein
VIFASILYLESKMIIKKLAVPLINEKILAQAEHCTIATAAISEQAFDFIKNRLHPKCKIDIVIGLDGLTSPEVLRRVWRHYQDRITLKIYTKNIFHANLYIFDMPFRKAIAFVGTGHLTLGGIKDHEEIFYKITEAKEIEGLRSWLTSYYEFSEPLTENLVDEYELIYPAMKQREIASRDEKEHLIALTTRGFNWDTIRFKTQYFKKEDYLVFANSKASISTAETQLERTNVKNKLLQLHALIREQLSGLSLYEHPDLDNSISVHPSDYPEQKLRTMHLPYGRDKSELARYRSEAKQQDFMTFQVMIQQRDIGVWLVIGKPNGSREDREYFKKQMEDPQYRAVLFKTVQSLGAGYWLEVAGEKKNIESFATKEALWDFTKSDDWRYYTMVIGKNYAPGHPDIGTDTISATIIKEAQKLSLIYKHLKDAKS